MRTICFIGFCILWLACKQAGNEAVSVNPSVKNHDSLPVKKDYFPVTDFILGEINNIKSRGINPVKKTGRDSVYIRIENLEKEMTPFLNPVIDKNNMTGFFNESSFMDQSTHSFTFTYDPVGMLPDSISLRHWDVYVNPEKNTVWRIYLLKETDEAIWQLTWETGRNCKIVELSKEENGSLSSPKETVYNWDY